VRTFFVGGFVKSRDAALRSLFNRSTYKQYASRFKSSRAQAFRLLYEAAGALFTRAAVSEFSKNSPGKDISVGFR
jgi:hypothetical protein